jgi:hypothetical protein
MEQPRRSDGPHPLGRGPWPASPGLSHIRRELATGPATPREGSPAPSCVVRRPAVVTGWLLPFLIGPAPGVACPPFRRRCCLSRWSWRHFGPPSQMRVRPGEFGDGTTRQPTRDLAGNPAGPVRRLQGRMETRHGGGIRRAPRPGFRRVPGSTWPAGGGEAKPARCPLSWIRQSRTGQL